jgi:hypothetical protein
MQGVTSGPLLSRLNDVPRSNAKVASSSGASARGPKITIGNSERESERAPARAAVAVLRLVEPHPTSSEEQGTQ